VITAAFKAGNVLDLHNPDWLKQNPVVYMCSCVCDRGGGLTKFIVEVIPPTHFRSFLFCSNNKTLFEFGTNKDLSGISNAVISDLRLRSNWRSSDSASERG
jgi:hypothetical protein